MEPCSVQVISVSPAYPSIMLQEIRSNDKSESKPPVTPASERYPKIRRHVPRTSSGTVPDYSAWSVANLCCGVFFLGLIPFYCSVKVRSCRRSGEIGRAKEFSKWALITNIIATVAGLALWAYLIYAIDIAVRMQNAANRVK